MSLKKHIINIVLVICLIMCLGMTIGYYTLLKEKKNVTNFYLDGQEFGEENINLLQNSSDSSNGYTAWKETDNKSVINEDLGKSSTVKVLTICGNSSLVVESNKMLFKDDKNGCLVDKKTAYDLFGSENVKGNKIKYEDRTLYIRGIHNGEEHTLILETNYNSKEIFDGIAVDSKSNCETLANTIGIVNNGVNTSTYTTIAKIFLLIIPFMIIIPVLFELIRKTFKEKIMPVRLIINVVIIAAILIIFVKIVNIKFAIPYDIIPNKWSDFTYWSQFLQDYVEKVKYVIYMKKSIIDISYLNILFKFIVMNILSIGFFLSLRKRIKMENKKELLITLGAVLFIEFIVFIKLNTGDSIGVSGTMFWLMYPFYLLVNKWVLPLLVKNRIVQE